MITGKDMHSGSVLAVFVLFFAEAMAFGAWLPRLAGIKQDVGLSEGEIGLLLAFLPTGALAGMAAIAVILRARSVRFGAILSLSWMMTAIILLGLAERPVQLAVAFFAIGLGSGAVGVAMNAAASRVEAVSGRRILSTSHGLFSTGLALGGLSGGFAAELGLSIFAQGLLIQAVLAIGCAFTLGALPHEKVEKASADGAPLGPASLLALIPFGLVAFVGLLSEGAGLDWSAIYLTTVLEAEAIAAGAGVTALAGAMAAVRFTGDCLSARIGDGAFLGLGIALAAAGYAGLAAAPTPAMALLALAAVGAGLAPIAPVIFRSVSAGAEAARAARNIAFVSGIAYTGFLAGPVLVGLTAECFGMRISFLAISGALLASGAVVVTLRRKLQ